MNIKFLDKAIPLQGASHADVVDYTVDVPLRYAKCRARLADGRIVRLMDSRQFLGWSGYGRNPNMLFMYGRRRIVVQTGPNRGQKFITRDGGLLTVPRWRTKLVDMQDRSPVRIGGYSEQTATN